MVKFSVKKNKRHWNEFATSHINNKAGATFDEVLPDLESQFIISRLKKLKPRSLLDIGCGNGQRTAIFSKYVNGITIGIDYSENMIKQAKTIKKPNLFFEHSDVTKIEQENHFDAVVSCRCFINQNTTEKQIQLFNKLHKLLNPKGHLIIAEASVEGLDNLNKLRKSFKLKKIDEHWFNLHINEAKVLPKLKKLYKIEKINRLGLYYYIARVIQPALEFPKEPKRGSLMDHLAKQSQELFFDTDKTFEKYGRHLLIDFRKK